MFNVILLPEERRKLQENGYYFLENEDFLTLKNKYDHTLFELSYSKEIDEFILLLEDSCYYFTGLLFIEVSRMQVHLQFNWYAKKTDEAVKLEDGMFKKPSSWGVLIQEEE